MLKKVFSFLLFMPRIAEKCADFQLFRHNIVPGRPPLILNLLFWVEEDWQPYWMRIRDKHSLTWKVFQVFIYCHFSIHILIFRVFNRIFQMNRISRTKLLFLLRIKKKKKSKSNSNPILCSFNFLKFNKGSFYLRLKKILIKFFFIIYWRFINRINV